MSGQGGHMETEQRGRGPYGVEPGEVPPFQPDPTLVRWAYDGGSKESAMAAFVKTWRRIERERDEADSNV